MNSDLCIGTWTMGGEHFGPYTTENAIKTLEMAFDYGIRKVDTAAFYAHGNSLSILKKAISNKRDTLFISAKGGLKWNGNIVLHDASPTALETDLHTTLQALNIESLDLYSLHWTDPAIPLTTCIKTLQTFKKKGLIRHWGLGNLDQETAERVCGIGALIPFQYPHNLLRRNERLISSLVKDKRIESWVVSPLEQGRLGNAQYASHPTLSKKDFRHKNIYFSNEYSKIVEDYRTQAQDQGRTLACFAIEWLRQQSYVDTIVLGARTPEQLRDCMGAFITH